MNTHCHRQALIGGLILAACAAGGRAAPAVERSVLEVRVTAQAADPLMPWRRAEPQTRKGFAAVIGPRQAVTAERLVRNQVLVEIMAARSGLKIPARVLAADHQVGAALLAWDEPGAPADWRPLALAEANPVGREAVIIQIDETGRIQTDPARITDALVAPLPDARQAMLMFRALTGLNTGDPGAPVLCGDKLAGLALQSDRQHQTCLILPAAGIRRFLDDLAAPPYRGVASAGFLWARLVDPVKRAYRAAGPDGGGIEVLSVLPGSGAAAVLQPGDVIRQWDGADLDAQGYFQDPEFGRLLLPFLIHGRRRPGDTVPLRILRAGQPLTVNLALTRRPDDDALIPENTGLDQPDYIVECGLVFRELGGDYLRARDGEDNPRLAHWYLTRAHRPDRPGDRVVLLVGVLPDLANIGYQHIHNEVVTGVNGEPVRNLADIGRIMDRDGGLRRVSLLACGQDLVLDPAGREEANRRLADNYRLPALRRLGR